MVREEAPRLNMGRAKAKAISSQWQMRSLAADIFVLGGHLMLIFSAIHVALGQTAPLIPKPFLHSLSEMYTLLIESPQQFQEVALIT